MTANDMNLADALIHSLGATGHQATIDLVEVSGWRITTDVPPAHLLVFSADQVPSAPSQVRRLGVTTDSVYDTGIGPDTAAGLQHAAVGRQTLVPDRVARDTISGQRDKAVLLGDIPDRLTSRADESRYGAVPADPPRSRKAEPPNSGWPSRVVGRGSR